MIQQAFITYLMSIKVSWKIAVIVIVIQIIIQSVK